MQSVNLQTASKSLLGLLAGLALLTAYCQIHSIGGQGRVPLQVSFTWALSTSLWWAMAALILWTVRGHLTALVERRRIGDSLKAAGLVFAITLLAAALVCAVMALGAGTALHLSRLSFRLMQLAPACALGAGLLTTLLLLRRQRIASPEPVAETRSAWIPLPEEPQLILRKSDVSLIRSAGNYCELHAWGRVHLVRVTLSALAERLAGDGFVRVHRTAMVNEAHIRAVAPAAAARRLDVHLEGGLTVAVGRSFADSVKRLSGAPEDRYLN